jgi:hypothetical protein
MSNNPGTVAALARRALEGSNEISSKNLLVVARTGENGSVNE